MTRRWFLFKAAKSCERPGACLFDVGARLDQLGHNPRVPPPGGGEKRWNGPTIHVDGVLGEQQLGDVLMPLQRGQRERRVRDGVRAGRQHAQAVDNVIRQQRILPPVRGTC